MRSKPQSIWNFAKTDSIHNFQLVEALLSLLFFNVNIQSYVLSVPLGMIIYWAIRKQLLAKREAPSEPSDGKAGESVDGNDGQEQG